MVLLKVIKRKRIIVLFIFLAFVSCLFFILNQKTHKTQWFNFFIPPDDCTDNAVNVGKIVLDAPAGKHGFVQVKDGHFYFEDGTRIRFWGTNLTSKANFPSKEESIKLAGSLARYGFNCIRLHHMDSAYSPDGIFDSSQGNTQKLSDEQLDRLDYLIYQLKLKGIYVDINLHVGRIFTRGDGVADAGELPINSKLVTFFDRTLINLEKDYANKLLTHYNPYTKSAYNNEPCIAMVEVTNENSLFPAWRSGRIFTSPSPKEIDGITSHYSNMLDEKWNEWLRQKYVTAESLREAWNNGTAEQGDNMVVNSSFEDGNLEGWVKEIHKGVDAEFSAERDKRKDNYSLKAEINRIQEQAYMLQIKQLGIKAERGFKYTLCFRAKADKNRDMAISYSRDIEPYTNYGLYEKVNLSKEWKVFKYSFVANTTTDDKTRLSFILGEAEGKVWLDDIVLYREKSSGLERMESLEKGNILRTKWEDRDGYSEARIADNTEFYYSLESNYFKEMVDFLHKDLGIRVPVSASNNYYGQPDLMAQNTGDYMDTHMYWDHPSFPEKRWNTENFVQDNYSAIRRKTFSGFNDTASSFIGRISLSAVKGKPLVLSEWNHVFPNDFDYETAGIITSYAQLQDYDGLFVYTYSSERLEDVEKKNYIYNWFDIDNKPGMLAQMPACALAFIRGDFSPAERQIELNYSRKDIVNNFKYDDIRLDYNIQGSLPFSVPFIHGIRKASFDSDYTTTAGEIISEDEIKALSQEKVYTSDTGEISWNSEKEGNEFVSFNTARFQGAAGFLAGQKISLNNLDIRMKTDSAVYLTALDGVGIETSKHLLLTTVAGQKNTGQEKDEKNGLKDWGRAPVLLQAVQGELAVKVSRDIRKYRIYALDSSGNRTKRKSFDVKDGRISLKVGKDATPWYEICYMD